MATTKIRSSSIEDGSIVNSDLSPSIAVTGGQLADDSITTDKILDNNVTIAKIAGSASAAAGTFLSKDGTWAEAGGGGSSWQAVKTADFTAVAGEGYLVNTTAGAVTVTLPASPSVGDFVQVVDYAGTFQTNALTITASGSDKIEAETTDFVIKAQRAGATITYVDAVQGWLATTRVTAEAIEMGKYLVETLVIGGGGGGGEAYDGGGGAGGLIYHGSETPKTPNGAAFDLVVSKVYTIDIGAGGAKGGTGTNGGNTTFSGFNITTQIAIGGGWGQPGNSGGSGGGYGHGSGPGGAGTAGQGNAGGAGTYCSPGYPGGGGGGAGGAGAPYSGCTGPGAGGAGLDYSITGTSTNYAAGGGAGTWQGSYAAAGGNSAGAGNNDAPDGRGGGGGAAGTGGDGCVIIRMLTTDYSGTYTPVFGAAGAPVVTTDGLYTAINFTASGTYTA